LGALSIQSGDISLSGSFLQQGNGTVTLGNNITASGGILSFQAPITLTASVNLSAQNDLTLSSQVIGATPVDLSLDSVDEAIYVGQLGTDSFPLGTVTFTANGNSSLGGIVTENGDIDIRPPIFLTSLMTVLDTSSGSSRGSVRFQNTVNATNQGSSAEALKILAGSFDVTLDGSLGATYPLGGVDIVTTNAVTIGGNIFTTSSSSSILAGLVEIEGAVSLSGDCQIDTTQGGGGSAIIFSGTVDGNQNFMLAAGSEDITLDSDLGRNSPLQSFSVLSAGDVASQSVFTLGAISISPHITLSETPLTTFSSQNSGDILLGAIDGVTELRVSANSGDITLGTIGQTTPLEQVLVSTGDSVSIHSMTTTDVITITIPSILLDSTTLTAGNKITLADINATSTGQQALTINAGSSEVLLQGDIGTVASLGNLEVTGSLISFEGQSVFTAAAQQYHSPGQISQDIVFRSIGNITFEEKIDPVFGAPNLSVYVGGGTLTFADSVGDAPFGNVAVYNASAFIGHKIYASTLTVSGGLPVIYLEDEIVLSGDGGIRLDGGPILLGGSVDAEFVFFRSKGNISNIGSPIAITNGGSNLLDLSYFNAIGGVVGSQESPIEINTEQLIVVGAYPRADFIGTPMHSSVRLARGNAPCVVSFNGTDLINCNGSFFSARALFNSLPKDLFYLPGIYSSWNNLSNLEYFTEEPSDLGFNPRNRKLFYSIGPAEKKSLISQVFSGYTRIRKLKEALSHGKDLQQEPVSWDFIVNFSEEPLLLDLLPFPDAH
jgi:hypothetical protein